MLHFTMEPRPSRRIPQHYSAHCSPPWKMTNEKNLLFTAKKGHLNYQDVVGDRALFCLYRVRCPVT